MAARPSQAVIKRRLRSLANMYVGIEFRVLYASNGETAILPVNPATGETFNAYEAQEFLAAIRAKNEVHNEPTI